MQWADASTVNCPVGRALDVLGEKWMLLIVRDALNGVRRFDDFRRHMGLSEAVLADRLRKLVDDGILRLEPYQEPGQRPRNEYRVTPKGRDLAPVIVALKQWGEHHFAEPDGPVIEIRHRDCGGVVQAELRCADHADRVLRPADTYVVPGPGARPA